MKIEYLEEGNRFEWDEYVSRSPFSTVYHTVSWNDVLTLTFDNYIPLSFMVRDGSGEVRGVFPLIGVRSWFFGFRLISLPFSYKAGPLWDSRETLHALLHHAVNLCEKTRARYLEIRLSASMPDLEILGLKKKLQYMTSMLDLSKDTQTVWKKLRKGRRSDIRKAEREGVYVREGRSLNDLRILYQIFQLNKRKIGIPIFHFRMFELIWSRMYPDLARFFLAGWEDKYYALILILIYNRIAILAQNLQVDCVESRRMKPLSLACWHMIEWAARSGLRTVDFGISSIRGPNLRFFKETWGAKSTLVPYYFMPDVPIIDMDPAGPQYKVARSIWRLIPSSLTSLIGPVIIGQFE